MMRGGEDVEGRMAGLVWVCLALAGGFGDVPRWSRPRRFPGSRGTKVHEYEIHQEYIQGGHLVPSLGVPAHERTVLEFTSTKAESIDHLEASKQQGMT
ncbi:hypothetical protein BDY21DRAFT_348042 [Lineolata rhizophorae]|uniref:Uncharacterized protein n=1 Tax=Lineolata rhizophorae TaxID=578093 RepID=A0A6A6NWL2_9PEZI|nr:hypothetical protein BDY21DRAFT_348042 [Lineolata rhizophorae]